MNALFMLLLAIAASLAWGLARRRPDHRPIAWMLTIGLVGELAQHLLDVAVIAPLRAELWTPELSLSTR